MVKMNRKQLRALIQEAMRIGYELDGPRSEFYDDSAPEDDEAGLRFMSPRGAKSLAYDVDDSQDAMDMDLQLVPSDDYDALASLLDSGYDSAEVDEFDDLGGMGLFDDDVMMERSQIRKMIQEIMLETSKVVPAAAGAAAASGGLPGMGIGVVIAYLWATDQLGDAKDIAKDLMEKGKEYSGAYQLWIRLDPDVQQAAIDLANAAKNLAGEASEQIKNTLAKILGVADKA